MVTSIIIAPAIAALVVKAHTYTKKRGKAQGIEIKLGIDWNAIYKRDGFGNIKLKELMNELKYGTQRFIRGYDETMFSNFCDFLDLLIIEDLRYMIAKRRGSPIIDESGDLQEFEIEADSKEAEFNERQEKFTAALKKMLEHFEKSRDDKTPAKQQKWHHRQAREMLVKYYNSLWD